MKKILVVMLVIVMMFSITACNEKQTTDPEQNNTGEINIPGVNFVDKAFGYITISVPDVFGEVEEKDGMYVCAGPAASIVVTPTLGMDIMYEEWDESLTGEYIQMIYGSTYTDIELSAYEGDVDMNGNQAIYYACYGKNAEGIDRLLQVVRIYNADMNAQYMITLTHTSGDEFFTAEVGGAIINSITLSDEAQHLKAQGEY
ncbi:MAG TPA: hypothetical protein PK705_05150 [Clostridia bacterium]|jgi:hypothetical protein|nr:hypothetical protein [Clostridia bacterium]HQM96375.1 hypothetical protein [Clostridia bacterium]HQO69809.1 hypothetical protein [Clostridia bacterium]